MSQQTAITKNGTKELARPVQRSAVTPACDVYENQDEILVIADLPGVSADALNIGLHQGELTLEGHRDLALADGTYLGSEYRDCEFRRRFAVPGGIDADGIKAELKNGVLWLHLPKSEALKPRQISVRAG